MWIRSALRELRSKGENTMMNQYFGELTYSIGWKTTRDIQLFGKNHSITVKIQAYEPEDSIPPAQDQACRTYIENEAENLECMEKLMLEYSADAKTRFSPRRLLFDTDGGCALLCNDAEDEDEGIAVCILPDKCVMDQSDYL